MTIPAASDFSEVLSKGFPANSGLSEVRQQRWSEIQNGPEGL